MSPAHESGRKKNFQLGKEHPSNNEPRTKLQRKRLEGQQTQHILENREIYSKRALLVLLYKRSSLVKQNESAMQRDRNPEVLYLLRHIDIM